MNMLLECFDTIFDTEESVEKLEKLILDLAVKGKLISQDPNDDPASVLIEEIRKEKERLIAEKKIKKEKFSQPISNEEKPYELPQGWEWVRINYLFSVISSKNKQIKARDYKENGEYPIISQSKNYISGYSNDSSALLKIENPVVIFGDHTKEVKHVDFDFIVGADGTKILSPFQGLESEYLYIVIKSYDLDVRDYGRHFKFLNEKLLPLPSLNEQKRIVEKVKQLMEFCEELKEGLQKKKRREEMFNVSAFISLEQSETKEELKNNLNFVLSNLDSLCTESNHVKQLRKAILSVAVRGMLVPQNETDEPASALLEKIKEEKEKLIIEMKIKKEKPTPLIKDEEKPFDLPKGWEWVRLGELGIVQGGATPSKSNSNFWNGNIPWISPKDMKKKYIIDSIDNITVEALNETSSLKLFSSNSLLFVVRGMILAHSFPVAINKQAVCINQDMKVLTLYDENIIEFIYSVLISEKERILNQIERSTHGTCKLSTDDLFSKVIPIPPLNEQKRILDKVNQLMVLCDELEKSIEESKQESENLMKTVIQETLKG